MIRFNSLPKQQTKAFKAGNVKIGDTIKHPLKDWKGWWKVIQLRKSRDSVLMKLENWNGHSVPARVDLNRKVEKKSANWWDIGHRGSSFHSDHRNPPPDYLWWMTADGNVHVKKSAVPDLELSDDPKGTVYRQRTHEELIGGYTHRFWRGRWEADTKRLSVLAPMGEEGTPIPQHLQFQLDQEFPGHMLLRFKSLSDPDPRYASRVEWDHKSKKSLSEPDARFSVEVEWDNKNWRRRFKAFRKKAKSPGEAPEENKEEQPTEQPVLRGPQTAEELQKTVDDNTNHFTTAFQDARFTQDLNTEAKESAEQMAKFLGMGVVLGDSAYSNKGKHRTGLDYTKAKGKAYLGSPLPAGVAPGTAKECFKNATMLVLNHPEWSYCEGYAMRKGLLPVLHAWALTPEGKVVDNTFKDPEHCAYYGVAYPGKAYLKYVQKRKFYGVLGGDYKHAQKVLEKGNL